MHPSYAKPRAGKLPAVINIYDIGAGFKVPLNTSIISVVEVYDEVGISLALVLFDLDQAVEFQGDIHVGREDASLYRDRY